MMLLRSKLLFLAIPTLTLLITLTSSCGQGPGDARLIREGDEIVKKVERFRESKGRLPNSLSEIGVEEKEEGPIYYDKKSETRYVVWFGTVLGESVKYDSDKREWK